MTLDNRPPGVGLMNRIGKFEMHNIINAIDSVMIERFGVNLLDARITRQEALGAYAERQDPREAALLLGQRRGLSSPAMKP